MTAKWYYYGMGFRSAATRSKAAKIADKNMCRYKVTKSKDPLGGFLYKVYFSKSNVTR